MLIGHSVSDALGRILAVDDSICEMLHRSEAELIGMSYVDVTHPDDVTLNKPLVDKLQASAGPITIRKRHLRPDSTSIWSDVQVSRLGRGLDHGRLVGTVNRADHSSQTPCPDSLWRSAVRKDRDLQLRRTELGDDLFTDHPWLILLQLYIAEAEGGCISIRQISRRTRCREQSLIRWLKVLEEKKLIDRFNSEICAGQLTTIGIGKVESILEGAPEY
jgi:hypothetical protein